ncbi:MAG TPA: NTP transferase domain-containing protein [Actinomycetota bacterium]
MSPSRSLAQPADVTPLRAPRKAVVLAAGLSSRMAALSKGRSKAMLRVGGLSLLERCVRTLETVGISEIVVVLGHDVGRVGSHARAVSRRGTVTVVEARDWHDGNGRSLAAAEPHVADEELFLLVTVDHIFEPAALRELLAAGTPAVLIDRAPTPDEWDEGTKVELDDGHAIAFAKTLRSPAIDCGAFLLPPAVFAAHRSALAEGDASLAAAVTALAGRLPLRAVDVTPGTWTDVDVPEDVRRARSRLRRSLGKDGDGPVSRALNRPLSTRLSLLVSDLRVPPDAVSAAVAVLALVAAALLASGRGLPGGIAVQAVSVLDGVDGEVARLRLLASPRGAMLDGVLDRLSDVAIVGALGVWALGDVEPATAIWLTTLALAGAMLSMATKDRARALGLPPAPERWIGYLLGGRDGRMLVIAVASVFGSPVAALAVTAATSLLSVAIRVVAVMRRRGPR